MCPEFLREGSGVSDFFNPPFTVIGTTEPRVSKRGRRAVLLRRRPMRVVDVRTAEALKYACNAFHATKVSFANELARLFRGMDVDARTVMDLFCEDDGLNISPSYLRPGFAFGGSCLPKDLRALLYLAAQHTSTFRCCRERCIEQITIGDVVDRIVASDARVVALLGLSFKMKTDDLRESPNVTLAETLIGKGFNVRIYDPIVNPSRLVGCEPTLRRVEAAASPPTARGHRRRGPRRRRPRDRVVDRPRRGQRARRGPPRHIIDISGRLGADGGSTSPAIRASVGEAVDRRVTPPQRGTTSGAHHRAEPARSVRPAGLARVPGAASTRATRCTSCARRARATRTHEMIDGVTLHKYRPQRCRTGAARILVEYAWSLLMTALAHRARVRRGGRFDVIQTCNPPDIFWIARARLRRADRTRFVFDQHDLCPELFESRFARRARRCSHMALRWLERRTYRTADHVIATNESYAQVARRRGAASAATTSRSSAPAPTPTGSRRGDRDPVAAPRPPASSWRTSA